MELKYTGHPDAPHRFNEQAVRDMLDIFCVRDPGVVFVTVMKQHQTNTMIRGLYTIDPRSIYIYSECVQRCFNEGMPIGGNVTIAKTLDVAYAFVLRHEIQHMNQHILSGDTFSGSTMFSGKYRGRPGEVDARASVDSSQKQICELFGYPVCRDKNIEDNVESLVTVVDNLLSSDDGGGFSVKDIVEVLKVYRLNTPHSVAWVRDSLESAGIVIR